jgi:hypothetical protein
MEPFGCVMKEEQKIELSRIEQSLPGISFEVTILGDKIAEELMTSKKDQRGWLCSISPYPSRPLGRNKSASPDSCIETILRSGSPTRREKTARGS